MTYLFSKSFIHVPRSISIKGPQGIVSHHLLEMSPVYFGEKTTKQQMFNPQQQTSHSQVCRKVLKVYSSWVQTKVKVFYCFNIQSIQLKALNWQRYDTLIKIMVLDTPFMWSKTAKCTTENDLNTHFLREQVNILNVYLCFHFQIYGLGTGELNIINAITWPVSKSILFCGLFFRSFLKSSLDMHLLTCSDVHPPTCSLMLTLFLFEEQKILRTQLDLSPIKPNQK